MNLAILGLVVFSIYVTIRIAALASAWNAGGRYRAYRTLAARYHGRFESRGLGEPPTVSFSYNGSAIRVGLAPNVPGQPLGPRTRVVARFGRGLPFRLELAPAGRPAPPQPPRGTRPVLTGDHEFDHGFIVQANDAEMACSFLSPHVRAALKNLVRLAPPVGMLVSINPERLLVQVDRNLAFEAEALPAALREALIIHDGLRSGVESRIGQGIAIVEAGPALLAEAGSPVCKVCGDPIVSDAVQCGTCLTPHHRDCWEFVGSCSIYGCNGKKSTPV